MANVAVASSTPSPGAGPSSSPLPRQGPSAQAGSDPRLIVCGCFRLQRRHRRHRAPLRRRQRHLRCPVLQRRLQHIRGHVPVLRGRLIALRRRPRDRMGVHHQVLIFECWPARGMPQIFIAVMTKAYASIERNDLILFQEIASYMLLACGAVYVIKVYTTLIMALPPPPALPLPPPSAAALPEELIEEILLCFPPGDPASLFRAALVCKQWYRLISTPHFRRRFCELHRTPPMLGFICNGCEGSRFVPTTAFYPPGTGRYNWKALDAHHGRVLIRRSVPEKEDDALVVWDPITNEQRGLPFPPRLTLSWSVAVLCAGTATGACDHIDCHRGPFIVVFVGLDPSEMFVYTYSSDVSAWTEPISTEHPDPFYCNFIDVEKQPVLVGNALYFGIRFTSIMKYNLESCEMSLIQLPSTYDWSYWGQRVMLTTTQEGVLGLVTIDHFKLCIWLRKDTAEVDAGWTQSRVIDLKMLLPHDGVFTSHDVVGVEGGLGIIFMMVGSVLYTIDLKTYMVELYQYPDIEIRYIVPYMSFYTPELEAACAGEGPSEGGSSV